MRRMETICSGSLTAILALALASLPRCSCEPAAEVDSGVSARDASGYDAGHGDAMATDAVDAAAADSSPHDVDVADGAPGDTDPVDSAIGVDAGAGADASADAAVGDGARADAGDAGASDAVQGDGFVGEDASVPCVDLDGDGYTPVSCGGGDCDDTVATGAGCFDLCTVFYPDSDGDGIGDAVRAVERCTQPAGFVSLPGDCDDLNPGCGLVCDDLDLDGTCVDNDCDDSSATGAACISGCGTYYRDSDSDGAGSPASTRRACSRPPGYAGNADDCDDGNSACAATCVDADADGHCRDGDCDDSAASGASCFTGCGTYFRDADGDGLGDSGNTSTACGASAGFVSAGGDCDDAVSLCTTDCSDGNGNGTPDCAESCADADGDGYRAVGCGGIDCDDADPDVNPAVVEICGNGVDDDCDPASVDLFDVDGDGSACDVDCDDGNPGCASNCADVDGDGYCVDHDCDDGAATGGACHNTCLDFYSDADGDGWGDSGSSVSACVAPAGYVGTGGDCDDSNGLCDSSCTDADGDGACVNHDCDDNPVTGAACQSGCQTYYPDGDGDGFGDAATPVSVCEQPPGYVSQGGDCDDANARCDTTCTDADGDGYCLNHDCDDSAATGASCHGVCGTYYADTDGDGYGDPLTAVTACMAPAGHVADGTDCDDQNGSCDSDCGDADGDGYCVNHDCDDSAATGASCSSSCGSYYADSDGDGAGDPGSPTVACEAPAGYIDVAGDCDDGKPNCAADCADADGDGHCVDQDCDDSAATGLACHSGCATYHPDGDSDGYGDRDSPVSACGLPPAHVIDGSDCDDASPVVHPGMAEDCGNGVDDDCDDAVDGADPDCVVSGEICDNHADDDGDGDSDCADPDCAGVAPCRGNNCDDPRSLVSNGQVLADTLILSNAEMGSCQPAHGRDLVFHLVLSETSDLHVDTGGSSYDTVLYLRQGSCAAGAELACEDDLNPTVSWSRIDLPGLAAGDYYLWVDSALPDDGGDLVLNVATSASVPPQVLATADDPLIRMPGTQPGQGVSMEAPNRCLNCHADYDPLVEAGHGWKGSMMAQAARDPLFWAAMTVAAQDSIWALGRPNATDLCERCHFPEGWIEGRSDPTNASLMVTSDYDGVHCDVCHQMWDPFFEATHAGTREGNDWSGYWDEAESQETPSSLAAAITLDADRFQAPGIKLYNGGDFFNASFEPHTPNYSESTSGQFFISSAGEKRASFADAGARHSALYSRFHKSKYMCATCHDVSNPALHNLAFEGTAPGDGSTVLPSEQDPGHSYFHVERTFSEFMLSDYGLQGGAVGSGAFAPGLLDTSRPGDAIATCQDCHMRDRVGAGCDKAGTVIRPSESAEHPNSGVPQHDMTGGNAFITWLLASAAPGSPNYDAYNASLLGQGPGALTLDLSLGEGLDPDALLDGAARAIQNLQDSATIEALSYDAGSGELSFEIHNHTGHKLISGFPEGRRMWINIRAYDGGGDLLWEVNPYDSAVGTLRGLDPAHAPSSPTLGPNESYVDALVYEMQPSSSLTGETKSFHFVLSDGRYKDNRIPPRGFRIDEAAARHVEPVWQGIEDPALYSAAEYSGGYDEVQLSIVAGAARVEVELYYQTTSREYVEFLRDQINGTASTLPSPTLAGAAIAYVASYDPFFDGLRAWGDTMWELWLYNKDVPGAAPIEMTSAETP